MSDDNDNDLTRIENLTEFLHDEEDDFSDLETFKDDSQGASQDDDAPPSFSDEVTDPEIDIPDSFSSEETITDQENPFLSDSEDSFSEDSFSEDSFSEDSFSEDSFSEDGFSEDSFSEDSFSEDSFSEDSFSEDSFSEDSFSEDSFSEDSFSEDSFSEDGFSEESMSDESDSFSEDVEIDDLNDSTDFLDETSSPQEEIKEEVVVSNEILEPSLSVPPQESFKDIKSFSDNITYGNLLAEGNPPFSVIIKDLRFNEDVEDIIILLKEFGLIKDEDEGKMRSSLERGSAIIPRISEYAAIILCHKLRKFHLNLLMGLSDEIHPTKAISTKSVGTISKNNVYNNQAHNFEFKNKIIQISDIITTTTSSLEGMDIIQYLGVVSERTIVDMSHFQDDQSLESELIGQVQGTLKDQLVDHKVSHQNELAQNSQTLPPPPWPEQQNTIKNKACLADIYQSLIDKLKAHGLKFQGNAIVGINFVVTPILVDSSIGVSSKYQISCTGSVVWVSRK